MRQLPARESAGEIYFYMATQSNTIAATPDDFMQSGLGTSAVQLKRPALRAQEPGALRGLRRDVDAAGVHGMGLADGYQSQRSRLDRVFGLALAGITAALFMTETRATRRTWTGLPDFTVDAQQRQAALVAIGAVVLLLVASTVWIEASRGVHWFEPVTSGIQFRALMWEDGARLVRQHPWFGVGMGPYAGITVSGTFAALSIQRGEPLPFDMMQIAVEREASRATGWLWFTVAYIVSGSTYDEAARRTGLRPESCWPPRAFSALTLTSFVHYNLGEEPVAMLLFFYYGLAAAIDRMASTNNDDGLTT
jgi:hypothetical protein